MTQHRPYTNNKIQESTLGRSKTQQGHLATSNTANNAIGKSNLLSSSHVSVKKIDWQLGGKNSRVSGHKISDEQFVSPPTQEYTKLVKPAPTVLDKSNSSIARMSESQRKDYATDKLLQLDSIDSMYDQAGG